MILKKGVSQIPQKIIFAPEVLDCSKNGKRLIKKTHMESQNKYASLKQRRQYF